MNYFLYTTIDETDTIGRIIAGEVQIQRDRSRSKGYIRSSEEMGGIHHGHDPNQTEHVVGTEDGTHSESVTHRVFDRINNSIS